MLPIIPLIAVFPITATVTITLHYQHFARILAHCPHHPPGLCCRALPLYLSYHHPAPSLPAHSITFTHLLPSDIAAVFPTRYRHNLPYAGCTTPVIASGRGPGTFTHTPGPAHEEGAQGGGIGGGSYVSLGQLRRLPPELESARWLVFEGVRGLVWGGGEWFSDVASRRRIIEGIVKRERMGRGKRGIRSERKGRVYIHSPARWVYPAIMEVDGVEFRDGGLGNLVYLMRC